MKTMDELFRERARQIERCQKICNSLNEEWNEPRYTYRYDDCVRFIESDMLFTSGMLYKELITLPIGTYAKDGDITEDEGMELIELVRKLGDDVLKVYGNRKKANQ